MNAREHRNMNIIIGLIYAVALAIAIAAFTSIFAEEIPDFLAPSLPALQGNMTVLHPTSGVTYLWDSHGNQVFVYEQAPGLSWYSLSY
jgi:hypothetical protein